MIYSLEESRGLTSNYSLAYAEMRLTLAKLLWNFDFGLTDDSDTWLQTQKVYLIWEKIPLLINLRPRS